MLTYELVERSLIDLKSALRDFKSLLNEDLNNRHTSQKFLTDDLKDHRSLITHFTDIFYDPKRAETVSTVQHRSGGAITVSNETYECAQYVNIRKAEFKNLVTAIPDGEKSQYLSKLTSTHGPQKIDLWAAYKKISLVPAETYLLSWAEAQAKSIKTYLLAEPNDVRELKALIESAAIPDHKRIYLTQEIFGQGFKVIRHIKHKNIKQIKVNAAKIDPQTNEKTRWVISSPSVILVPSETLPKCVWNEPKEIARRKSVYLEGGIELSMSGLTGYKNESRHNK